MIYKVYLNESQSTTKFKGVSIEYDEKDSDSLKKDIRVLNSNYSDIVKSQENKQDIKTKKLISVRYGKFKNDMSFFDLSFETDQYLHILTIVVYLSENKVKKIESWVDG